MAMTFMVEVAMAEGARSPYVAINRRTVFLDHSEYGWAGFVTVPESIDPDGKYLLTHSFIGPVGAKSRVRISSLNTAGRYTTPWVKITPITEPYGASYRRFSI